MLTVEALRAILGLTPHPNRARSSSPRPRCRRATGDPVEMLQLHPDGSHHVALIGPDLEAGHRPQVIVPRHIWQGARLRPGGRYALLGTTVAPGFDYADYETASRPTLLTTHPEARDLITALTK